MVTQLGNYRWTYAEKVDPFLKSFQSEAHLWKIWGSKGCLTPTTIPVTPAKVRHGWEGATLKHLHFSSLIHLLYRRLLVEMSAVRWEKLCIQSKITERQWANMSAVFPTGSCSFSYPAVIVVNMKSCTILFFFLGRMVSLTGERSYGVN